METNEIKKAPEQRIPERNTPVQQESLLSKELLSPQVTEQHISYEDTTLQESDIPSQHPAPATGVPITKSEIRKKIENILAENLGDSYRSMDATLRQHFKEEGHSTAQKIEQLLTEAKIKTKKIFQLIVEWLKLIPGVNTFFITQEAKIKTDKILHLR